MVTDDFSFPTVTDYTAQYLTVSPSLWRFSSSSSSIFSDGRGGKWVRKSMSSLETKREAADHGCSMSEADLAEEEEKMDMLWEDLNEEELQSQSSFGSRSGGCSDPDETMTGTGTAKGKQLGDHHQQEITYNISKTSSGNGTTSPKKAARINVAVIKVVLKKLFLLHNKAQLKKSS